MNLQLNRFGRLRYYPIWQIVLARLRESYRRPETIFWVYVFPIIMVVALGIAFRNRPTERFVVDVQQGPFAKKTVQALSTKSNLVARICAPERCRIRLRSGKSDLTVVAKPPGPRYEYRFDPTRPESSMARNAVDDAIQEAAGRSDPVQTQDQLVREPGGRYIDFLVPGLLGLSLMGGGLWGVGFATVDMRIRKLLKRLVATPMKKSHFLIGIMISRLVFTITEVILLLVFSWLVFGVVSYGSLWAVAVLVLLGATAFAGVGLLVASRAQTLEAVSGLMNLVMLPMWILSGVFFPSDRFPDFAQPFIKLLPLTPLNNALRNVMVDGAGLAAQSPEMILLAAWGLLTFALALRWFRWT